MSQDIKCLNVRTLVLNVRTARPAGSFLIGLVCCLATGGGAHLSKGEVFFSGYDVPGLFTLMANQQLMSCFRKDETDYALGSFELW